MAPILYGQLITLQNGWNNWEGGFLDTRGYQKDFQPHIDNYLCVSTATADNRDNGSGMWKIMSAAGKPEGSEVLSGDAIHLQNWWNDGRGGFLDTRGYQRDFQPQIGNYLCVSTAAVNNRDNGSGTWIVELVSGTGVITQDVAVTLRNNWNNGGGGFLDTRGYQRDFESQIGNYLCVSTATVNNRDNGSGQWRFAVRD